MDFCTKLWCLIFPGVSYVPRQKNKTKEFTKTNIQRLLRNVLHDNLFKSQILLVLTDFNSSTLNLLWVWLISEVRGDLESKHFRQCLDPWIVSDTEINDKMLRLCVFSPWRGQWCCRWWWLYLWPAGSLQSLSLPAPRNKGCPGCWGRPPSLPCSIQTDTMSRCSNSAK